MANEVHLREGESFAQMLKRFDRMTVQSGLKRDVKEKQWYKKPSEKKREKRLRTIKRERKRIAKIKKRKDSKGRQHRGH